MPTYDVENTHCIKKDRDLPLAKKPRIVSLETKNMHS